MTIHHSTTIAALSSGTGGAIALVRLSGPEALLITERVFSKPLRHAAANTVHFGTIRSEEKILDEVLVTLFRAPHSYTGEDMVEISCHGSSYIVNEILSLLIRQGAIPATAGEFTQRAFLNGKLDLSQAEAVADLIASDSASAHRIALNQMRGGYTVELAGLREKLLHITSLLELELDFSEEDVEFADREELKALLVEINQRTQTLSNSFRMGNALKNGVPVAIVGEPNAGKSTLLNLLLNEERAIVSDIAGTTRDFIEETLILDGILFRFIDTAGLRHTTDSIEALGIERTRERIAKAYLVLLLVPSELLPEEAEKLITNLNLSGDQKLIVVLNKSDLWQTEALEKELQKLYPTISLSARQGIGLDELKSVLVRQTGYDHANSDTLIVNNTRHYQALVLANEAMERALAGLEKALPTDLISEEVRNVLHHLGTITGQITTDDILGNIFSKFCIGK